VLDWRGKSPRSKVEYESDGLLSSCLVSEAWGLGWMGSLVDAILVDLMCRVNDQMMVAEELVLFVYRKARCNRCADLLYILSCHRDCQYDLECLNRSFMSLVGKLYSSPAWRGRSMRSMVPEEVGPVLIEPFRWGM
jgi:hypothetical protein